MEKFEEENLRCRFECERLEMLASRLLRLSGARSLLIMDKDPGVDILCSTGRLEALSGYVGDALASSDDLDLPLKDIV